MRRVVVRAWAFANLLVVGLIVFAIAGRVGIYLFGTSLDDTGNCLRAEMRPMLSDAVDHPELRVRGARTLLPFGLVCTTDEPGGATPPRVVIRQNWPLTVVGWGALIPSLVALGLLAVAIACSRIRSSSPTPRD